MRLLDRYIGKAVLAGTLLALGILLPLLGFLAFVDELGDVGTGNYGAGEAFAFVMLTLPRFAQEVFPVAALLGSLVGLGGLANHSELTAMRAAGVSLTRLLYSVLKVGLLMMIVAVIVGEFIAPFSEQAGERMRAEAQSEQITLKTKYGFWARDGKAFVNIRKILSGSRLGDIYIYEFEEDKRLKLATYARFAQYQSGSWQLRDIRQSALTPDGVQVRSLEQATWSSLLDPGLLNLVVIRPTILPVWGLYKYIDFMEANGQDAQNLRVAFWGKIVSPMVVLGMLFLSVPFVFGSLRTVGIGQRAFAGAMIGVGFFLLNKAIAHLAIVYELSPILAAAFPGLVVVGLAAWSLRKVY